MDTSRSNATDDLHAVQRLLLGVLFAAAGWLHSGTAAAQPAPPSIEVVHFWESGGERAALDVVQHTFESQGGVWKDRMTKGNDASRKIVLDRIVAGYPPAAMQWHAGSDLRDIVEMGAVHDINDVAMPDGWAKTVPKLVMDRITYQGKVYLAPIGIHAENWFWSNSRVLADAGLKVPSSWAEFLKMAPVLEKRGIVPLAIGGGDWEAEILFNAILVSTVGKDAFRRLLDTNDLSVLRSPQAVEAFRILGQVSRHVGTSYRKHSWSDATAEVIAGRAATQLMGDWAKGEFLKAGMTPGKQFDCHLAPGNADLYQLVIDAFAFPVVNNPAKHVWQSKLARTMVDPSVQVRFSQLKGSIPVRNDVDVSKLDKCARLGMQVVGKPENQALPPSMRLQFNVRAAMLALVGQFFHEGNISPEQAAERLAQVFSQRNANMAAR